MTNFLTLVFKSGYEAGVYINQMLAQFDTSYYVTLYTALDIYRRTATKANYHKFWTQFEERFNIRRHDTLDYVFKSNRIFTDFSASENLYLDIEINDLDHNYNACICRCEKGMNDQMIRLMFINECDKDLYRQQMRLTLNSNGRLTLYDALEIYREVVAKCDYHDFWTQWEEILRMRCIEATGYIFRNSFNFAEFFSSKSLYLVIKLSDLDYQGFVPKKGDVEMPTKSVDITSIETYNGRVVLVRFSDGTFTKAIRGKDDPYDFDMLFTVAILKRMLGTDGASGHKAYHKMIQKAHKILDYQEKAKQKAEEEKQKRRDIHEKRRLKNQERENIADHHYYSLMRSAFEDALNSHDNSATLTEDDLK